MSLEQLRTRAEAALRVTRSDVRSMSPTELQRVIHELQIHQIELEMQNETLRVTQRELEQSEERYRELFDSGPMGYVSIDAMGRVVSVNQAALLLLGLERAKLLGKRLAQLFTRQDRQCLEECIRNASTGARGELRLPTRGAPARYAQVEVSAVPSRPGACLIGLVDCTDRKLHAQALEALNQEIATRNQQLQAEIASRNESETRQRALELRLREARRLESLGLLSAGIAHDFNNLLVSVLGNADVLLRTPKLPDGARHGLRLIKRASSQASDLTRQLLVFAGRGQVTPTAVSLPKLVAENMELLRTRVPAGVQLQAQLAGHVPEIAADCGQLNQLIINLITNAIEALDGPGAITVTTTAKRLDAEDLATFQHHHTASPGDYAVLQVRDSGPGIDEATLARMFDPFFSTKFTGRGLGLSSVLGIVQAHHGALGVRTALGAGTCFEIALPVASARHCRQPKSAARPRAWRASGRVLLIDDNDAVRNVMSKLLRVTGFDVSTASGGVSGLELYRKADPPFKLIVLDWTMPGFSGDQVLKALRAVAPEQPVLVVTGHSAESLALPDTHLACVQKPCTVLQLQAAISSLLDSPAPALPASWS
jgi:PAS domain S-box-containing protein